MRRRDFLAGLSAAGLLGACGPGPATALPPLTVSGANLALGHRLRRPASADFPAPGETRRVGVLIVGGGIGGLGTAWRLARAGFDDFLLAELETEPGGNSRAGRNAVTEYPLGAHYLPLPPPGAVAVRELLRELGALRGSGDRLSDYEETLLAAAPQERLYIDGWWQDGVWPTHRASAAELAQQQRFQALVGEWRKHRDARGRRAFALPLDHSSAEPRWRGLDRLGFRDWLLAEGFDAPGIHWMANYATRDDYGTSHAETSAWAGLHYFACRADDALEGQVLTAPGGNAWLARGLGRAVGAGRLLAPALAWRVEEGRQEVACDLYLPAEERSVRVLARRLVWAAPLLTVPHVFSRPPAAALAVARRIDYAPWVVVNLALAAPPHSRGGAGLAWDNVIHDSAGLGYVVATHQALRYAPGPTTITWYRALHETAAPSRQRRLLELPPTHWADEALADLSRPHPGLRETVLAIDVHRYGHAMVRPTPGTIWDPARAALKRGEGRLHFAHADVSGVSLFEEALQRGVAAAEDCLRGLGRPPGGTLA